LLNVRDSGEGPDAMRALSHGTIIHGKQFLEPDRRDWPTSYYGLRWASGLLWLDARAHGALRVGVVGLGAGTLAAYGRAATSSASNDIIRLVELSPARNSLFSRTAGEVEVALGDARLSMRTTSRRRIRRSGARRLFKRCIPVHLLTVEAFKPICAISSRRRPRRAYLQTATFDLVPVVQQAARRLSLELQQVENDDEDRRGCTARLDAPFRSPAAFEGQC